jgi:hypothetical protein
MAKKKILPPSQEAIEEFIKVVQEKMDWNGAVVEPAPWSRTIPGTEFIYNCYSGQGIHKEFRQMCKENDLHVSIYWMTTPEDRTEAAGLETHDYHLIVRTDLNKWLEKRRNTEKL